MMRRHVNALILALAIGLAPSAQAQDQAQTGDITIDSVLKALHAGDLAVNFATLEPARHNSLDSLIVVMRDLRATDLTIAELATAVSEAPPGFLEILRWDRERASRLSQPALFSSLLRLQQITLGAGGHSLAQHITTVQPASYRLYMGAMEALQDQVNKVTQSTATEKLRKYEIKFGAAAPRLNPVETAVNYLLERVPGIGFGPTASGPGPLEFVASYSTTEPTATRSWTDVRLGSAAHVGLRIYNFDTTSTRGTIARFFSPSYYAIGGTAMAPNSQTLHSPFATGFKWGGFIDLGALRIAGALGNDWRAVIGTGAQLIPYVF